jgi:hypothetical protein
MTSIAQWSTTKVTLLAAAWLIAVPAALVAVVRLIAWHRMAGGTTPDEPYWASVDVGGWWVPLVWFVPPVALIAVRIWWAEGDR